MCYAFLHGFCLALGLILPLGVQNIFIFNQGATQPRFIYALPCILTAAICDTVLILLAALGVALIVLQIVWLKLAIFILGFVFLFYMGFVTWRAKPHSGKVNKLSLSAGRQIMFSASVSILNPHAVIDSITVIGSNSLSYSGFDKAMFAAACILVSWLWFFGIAYAGHKVHELDHEGLWLRRVNKFSALVIWSVAFYILWQIFSLINTH